MNSHAAYVLAVDQGTSGTGATLYDRELHIFASVNVPVRSIFPQPGWVEQDPNELLDSIRQAIHHLLDQTGVQPGQIAAFGLANQGETLLLWDTVTGEPAGNLIGWQCVRSADLCRSLIESGHAPSFKQRTGLPLDPEWPATKVGWMLNHVPGAAELARSGRLAFSQADSWFMRQLTSSRELLTDHATASRSGFYNISQNDWDPALKDLFAGFGLLFPRILNCADDFGRVEIAPGWQVPWLGNCLDQASALLGQACLFPGDVKITYGTCASLWYNRGEIYLPSKHADVSIAWMLNDRPTFALVGETISAGAATDWLKDKFHTGWQDAELSGRAASAVGEDEVIFVSALTGLGAPHWKPKTRGTLFGLTAKAGLEHLLRATLESIAFGVKDLADFYANEEGVELPAEIIADGGMTDNAYLMQFQANLLGKRILVPRDAEGTSKGVAFLAGYRAGFYPGVEVLQQARQIGRIYEPSMGENERDRKIARWRQAIELAARFYAE